MKIIVSFINTSYLLVCNMFFSQVGIGTNNPQKALHISGTTTTTNVSGTSINIVAPTIRIDGLNNTNQGISRNLTPVSVSDKGDLVLSTNLATPLVMINPVNTSNSSTNFLSSPVTITMSATSVNTLLKSFSFTLTFPSLVKFNASTSYRLYTTTGSVITDGASRLYGTQFKFITAPSGISTTSAFGNKIRSYANSVNNANATGIFYVISKEDLYLPAGNYTVGLYSVLSSNSSSSYFRAVCGNGSNTISIVAYPIQ